MTGFKNKYPHYITLVLPFLFCLFSFQATPVLADNSNKLPIYGRTYQSLEDVDSPLFPANAAELQQALEKNRETVFLVDGNPQTSEGYYLKLRKEGDANSTFLALREIYPDNVECDTAVLLLAYQEAGKDLPLRDLHQFLLYRAAIPNDDPISVNDPYHVSYKKMLTKLGEMDEHYSFPVTLETVLPTIGDQAIIMVDGHIGIVHKVGEDTYTTSGWKVPLGIFTSEPRIRRPGESLGVGWGNVEIKAHIMITSP